MGVGTGHRWSFCMDPFFVVRPVPFMVKASFLWCFFGKSKESLSFVWNWTPVWYKNDK